MKKSFGLSLILYLVLAYGLGASVFFFGSEIIKFGLQSYGYELCNCRLEIKRLKWHVTAPSFFLIEGLKMDMVDSKIQIERLEGRVHIVLLDPTVFWKLSVNAKIQSGEVRIANPLRDSKATSSLEGVSVRDLARKIQELKRIDLELVTSNLKIYFELHRERTVMLDNINWKTRMQGEPFVFDWNFNSQLSLPLEYFDKPVNFRSIGKIHRYPEKIELVSTKIELMGIPLDIQGGFIFQNGSVDLKLRLKDFDVGKMQKVEGNGLINTWSGVVSIDVGASRGTNFAPWLMEAKINGQKLKGQLDLKGQNYMLKGPVLLDVASEWKYHSESGFEAPLIGWNIDLSSAKLLLENYLDKPEDIKFASQGQLRWKDVLSFDETRVQVDRLDVGVDGDIEISKKVEIDFDVKPLRLEGLERYFPFMNRFPLKGGLELEGSYRGDLNEPEKASLNLTKLIVDKAQGSIDWKSTGLRVNGPFAINFRGGFNIAGKQVKSGELDLKLDLTQMEIQSENHFYKPSNSHFELNLVAKEEGGSMKARASSLKSAAGLLAIEGILPMPPTYSLNLNLSSERFLLAPLKTLFPEAFGHFPDGQLKANLNFTGDININELLASRTTTKGTMKILIPSFRMVEKAAEGKSNKTKVPEPIFPRTRFFQSMSIDTDVAISQMTIEDLSFSDVQAEVRIEDGKASGRSVIGRFLGGRVEFPFFEIPLLSDDPKASFKIKATQLNFADGLLKFIPPLSGLASGHLNAEFTGSSRLRRSPNFLGDLQSSGSMTLNMATFAYFPLKDQVDQQLISVRGAREIAKSYNFNGSNLAMSSEFVLARNDVSLKSARLRNQEGHELQFNGKIGYDRKILMDGELILFKIPPTTNFVVANRDQQGALAFAINIEGNLAQPRFLLIDDAIMQMVQKSNDRDRSR